MFQKCPSFLPSFPPSLPASMSKLLNIILGKPLPSLAVKCLIKEQNNCNEHNKLQAGSGSFLIYLYFCKWQETDNK